MRLSTNCHIFPFLILLCLNPLLWNQLFFKHVSTLWPTRANSHKLCQWSMSSCQMTCLESFTLLLLSPLTHNLLFLCFISHSCLVHNPWFRYISNLASNKILLLSVRLMAYLNRFLRSSGHMHIPACRHSITLMCRNWRNLGSSQVRLSTSRKPFWSGL